VCDLTPDQGVMSSEQIAPGSIAEAGRPLGRSDDVGEENRREHAIVIERLVLACDELLHSRKNAVDIALVVEVLDAVDLHEARPCDVVGQVASERERQPLVVAPVEH
jgi:hypothetical protein